MKSRKLLLGMSFLVVFLLATFLLTFSSQALAEEGKVSQKPIRIGTEGAYEPFNFIGPDGKLKGFDIDIARELCKEMKRECQFITQSWDGIIPGLILGKYDAIVASMSITEKRKKKVLFSESYYTTPAKFAVRKGDKIEISKKGLKGKTIGVQRGTVHQNYLEGEFKSEISMKMYATQEEANLDLLSGRLDAIVADSAVLYGWIQKKAQGKIEFIGPDLKDPKYFGLGAGVALRKKDSELKIQFDKAIAKVKNSGVYDQIRKKYFPFDIK